MGCWTTLDWAEQLYWENLMNEAVERLNTRRTN